MQGGARHDLCQHRGVQREVRDEQEQEERARQVRLLEVKDDDDDAANDDENKSETNASKKCKAERGTTAASIAAFNEKYGTNKNKKNGFGKCVSKYAKQKS